MGGHHDPQCPLISVLCCAITEERHGERERARKREKHERDKRLERRKEAGHVHMLPLCAKPHWLRQPTHTLHCCCCQQSGPLQHIHHGTTQSNKAGVMNLERDRVSPVSALPEQGSITQTHYTNTYTDMCTHTHTHKHTPTVALYRAVAFSCSASQQSLKCVILLVPVIENLSIHSSYEWRDFQIYVLASFTLINYLQKLQNINLFIPSFKTEQYSGK